MALLAATGFSEAVERKPSKYEAYQGRPIEFIEEVLGEHVTDDVKAMIDAIESRRVVLARSANAVGKTHGAARYAVYFFSVWEDAQVYTAAAPPIDNLTRLLWGEIGKIIDKHPEVFEGMKMNALNIGRNSYSFLTGVTIPSSGTEANKEGRFSGKHAPHLLFILDEGDAIPEEVYKGIESCLSGGDGGLLALFNPRQEAGPLYIKERDKQAYIVELTAFAHPNVITGEDVIPGAVTREKTVKRINEWTRPLMSGEKRDAECYEIPDFFVGAVAESDAGVPYPPLEAGWRKVTNPAFSYMVLARYPSQGEHQLIAKTWIYAARSRWDAYVAQFGALPPVGVRPVLGIDVAEFGADSNTVCVRYGGWISHIDHWEGVDVMVTASRCATLYAELGAEFANVDATGLGAGVAPAMKREGALNSFRVMVASAPTKETEMGAFGLLRDQLWWEVREWLRTDPGAMLPPDEMLMEELGVPTYGPGKVIKVMDKDAMKKLLGRSPDRAEALIMTFAPNGHTAVFAGAPGSPGAPRVDLGAVLQKLEK